VGCKGHDSIEKKPRGGQDGDRRQLRKARTREKGHEDRPVKTQPTLLKYAQFYLVYVY
jgi:hypothetical protein